MGAGELFETPAKEAAEVPAGTWDGWAHALLPSISQGGVVRVDRLTHLLGGLMQENVDCRWTNYGEGGEGEGAQISPT